MAGVSWLGLLLILWATLGAVAKTERVTIGGDAYRVEWLARENFTDPAWEKNWVKEGSSQWRVSDGHLLVTKPVGAGGEATIWYRAQLPADLIVRFKTKSLSSDANNKNNLNLISHARETDGAPVKYGRSGKYAEYHAFPNYIVTFVSGNDDHSRVRRNPGFHMVAETKDAVKPDMEYNLVLVVQNGRLRYYINGRRVHEVQDPAPLAGGQFAIRTWNTTAWWDDFEFGRVLP